MKTKSILFIAPTDFGFYNHIINEMKENGIEVLFIEEKFRSGFMFIDMLVLNMPNFILNLIHKLYFYSKIRRELKRSKLEKVDTLFMVRGRYLNTELLCFINRFAKAQKKIMYQWDYEKNVPLIKEQCEYFDLKFSFDKNDAEKYNLKHLPLFFNRTHKENAIKSNDKYQISFIGTHHSDRIELLKIIESKNSELCENSFFSLYRPKLSYYVNKILRYGTFSKVTKSDLNFNKINENETISIMSNSEIILDLSQVEQQGMTIRTFEALGLKKKLITTNPHIKQCDFYHENNVFVLDRANPKVSESFIDSDYYQIPEDIYQKYFITTWLSTVLDENLLEH